MTKVEAVIQLNTSNTSFSAILINNLEQPRPDRLGAFSASGLIIYFTCGYMVIHTLYAKLPCISRLLIGIKK